SFAAGPLLVVVPQPQTRQQHNIGSRQNELQPWWDCVDDVQIRYFEQPEVRREYYFDTAGDFLFRRERAADLFQRIEDKDDLYIVSKFADGLHSIFEKAEYVTTQFSDSVLESFGQLLTEGRC